MGRILTQRGFLGLILLPGVARKAHRTWSIQVRGETFKRLELRIDERIHRIDDDRAHLPPFWMFAEHVVNNRDQVGEALARACPGGDDIMETLRGQINGGSLVLVLGLLGMAVLAVLLYVARRTHQSTS
jgi:hypothetical protein